MSKKLSIKYNQKLIDQAKQSATNALKTASKKKTIKKQQKQLVIKLERKLLIKLEERQKLHQRIIQKQIKEKYYETDLHLQN